MDNHHRSILKVVVAGAGGRTGRIAYRKLKERPDLFQVRGLVRSQESKERLGGANDVHVIDITKPDTLRVAFSGMDALIVLTSSIPKMKPNLNPALANRPDFYFDEGGSPEQVDYIGQVNQFEVAKENGFQHIVLVSSMGGKYPNHPLNSLGDGNILIWKRKSEEYLKESGLPYTIIRSGLLEDSEGGKRELLAGVDDELLHSTYRRLPREDLAEICVQVLIHKEARFKTFDLVAKPVGEGTPTRDFKSFFSKITTSF